MLDASAFAALVMQTLLAIVAALVSKGWPGLAPWWQSVLTDWMQSGCRRMVACVGRRGLKSSTACLFAVAFALVFAKLGLVPPGDIGWVIFVSVRREEARSRMREIAKILDAIGVAYTTDGDSILLSGTNIGFRVLSCNVAAVSGWTCILFVGDEMSRWRDEDGRERATEVLATIRPTQATLMPWAREMDLSSPLDEYNAHARAFAEGNNEHQCVYHAPTWRSNPLLSEADCRALEQNEQLFQREYGAIAQHGPISGILPAAQLVRCLSPRSRLRLLGEGAMVGDPAGTGEDRWTYARVQWCRYETSVLLWKRDENGDPIPNPAYSEEPHVRLAVWGLTTIDSAQRATMSGQDIVKCMVDDCRASGIRQIYTDGYQGYFIDGELKRICGNGPAIRHETIQFTNARKQIAVATARRMLADRTLCYVNEGETLSPELAALHAEMNAFEERASDGILTYNARRGFHDDLITSAIILPSMLESAGKLVGSPHRRSGARYEILPHDPNYEGA